MAIFPFRHGWCVPLTATLLIACCAYCDRELDHSYLIYYGHNTLQNCVIHANPHTHTSSTWPGLYWNTHVISVQQRCREVEEEFSWKSQKRQKDKYMMEQKRSWKKTVRDETNSPGIREEANRQREKSNRGGDLFLTTALSSSSQWQNKLLWCLWRSALT